MFRELLKELRRTRNVTQVELARRLGRPQSYVSKFENGERRLDFVETAFVCEALGVNLAKVAERFTRRLNAITRAKQEDRSGEVP